MTHSTIIKDIPLTFKTNGNVINLFSHVINTGYECSIAPYTPTVNSIDSKNNSTYASFYDHSIVCYDHVYNDLCFGGEYSDMSGIDIAEILGDHWYYDYDSREEAEQHIKRMQEPDPYVFDDTLDLDSLSIVDVSYFQNEAF